MQETHTSFAFRGAGRPALQRPGASSALGELTVRKRASHGSTRSSKALFTVGCISGQSAGEGPASPGGARGNGAEQGGELGGGQESQGWVGGCPRPPGAGHAGPETAGWGRPGQGSVPGIPGPCQLSPFLGVSQAPPP